MLQLHQELLINTSSVRVQPPQPVAVTEVCMQQERTAVSPIVLTQSDQFDIDVEPTSEASHPLEQGKGTLQNSTHG